MKKIVLFSLVGSLVLAGVVSESYAVKGMHCQFGCANKVQAIMSELEGVQKCEVDFETSKMVIEYDDKKLNSDLIISTIVDQTTYQTKKIEKEKEKKNFWNILKGLFS